MLMCYRPEDERYARTYQCFDGNRKPKGVQWRELLCLQFEKVTLLVTNDVPSTANEPPDVVRLLNCIDLNLVTL